MLALDDQGQFSINGQRADANYFSVDGVSANFGVTGLLQMNQTASGALPALSASGGTNSLVSVDAMQEFRVQTSSFAPEFGRTPGGQVSIVTRSGTNALHGTVFEYFRNNVLDARDWFVNANNLAKPLSSARMTLAAWSVAQFSRTRPSSSFLTKDFDCGGHRPSRASYQTTPRASQLHPRCART